MLYINLGSLLTVPHLRLIHGFVSVPRFPVRIHFHKSITKTIFWFHKWCCYILHSLQILTRKVILIQSFRWVFSSFCHCSDDGGWSYIQYKKTWITLQWINFHTEEKWALFDLICHFYWQEILTGSLKQLEYYSHLGYWIENKSFAREQSTWKQHIISLFSHCCYCSNEVPFRQWHLTSTFGAALRKVLICTSYNHQQIQVFI